MISFKECQLRHKYGYVYKFTNKLNNKSYVGVSTNPELRYRRHLESAKNNHDTHFYRAIRKYGIESFEYSIIEKVLLSEMYSREKYWISEYDSYHNGYNSTLGGEGGNTYGKRTESQMKETRSKLSEAKRGSRNGNKGQYVGDKNPMYGKSLNPEHKLKMSKALKGKKKPDSMRENLSKATKGVPKSYIPYCKYLYLYNTTSGTCERLQARDIKSKLNLPNYKYIKEVVDNKLLVDEYMILESQETIEKLASSDIMK